MKSESVLLAYYSKAKVDTFYYDSKVETDYPCEVRIEGNEIIASYEDEAGYTISHKGTERGALGTLHSVPQT